MWVFMKRIGDKSLTAKFAVQTFFGKNVNTVMNTALLIMTVARIRAVVLTLCQTWSVTFATENTAGTFVQTAIERK